MNARQVRMIRIANGIQQKELAELINVPASTWANVENGHGVAHREILSKAVSALKELGCDFSVLQRGIDYPKYARAISELREKEEVERVPYSVYYQGETYQFDKKEEAEKFMQDNDEPKQDVAQPSYDATRPSHYHKGGIDLFEFLEMKWTPEQMEAFYAGNILKYILRYNDKNGVEDLKKARVYLDKLINQQEETQ